MTKNRTARSDYSARKPWEIFKSLLLKRNRRYSPHFHVNTRIFNNFI